jgi:hypothetical protein
MRYKITMIAGAAALASACASNQGLNTGSQPSAASAVYASTIIPTNGNTSGSTSAGSAGMWVDSVGGAWMDGDGAMYMGGQNGMRMGLASSDVSAWSNANIFAHLASGDSLEIQLSQAGVSQAQNTAVRDFARRMVSEHSAHLQTGMQLASQAGITPMPSPNDTADAAMAMRVINRLNGSNGMTASANNNGSSSTGSDNTAANGMNNWAGGGNYDRHLMRVEVMMHQHMLNELTMLRPRASGAAAQLIDQTIPVVRQHLSDAQAVWRQVGGEQGNTGNNSSARSQ